MLRKRDAYYYLSTFLYLPFAVLLLFGGSYLAVVYNPHSFSWLFASVINFLLARFVFLKDKDNALNRSFAVLSLCIAVWSLDVFGFYIIQKEETVVAWSRILRPGYLFLAPATYHFMLALSRKTDAWDRRLLFIGYGLSSLFCAMNFTGYFENSVIKRDVAYFPRIGLIYILSLAQLAAWSLMGLIKVFTAYRHSSSLRERKQYQYIFIASASVGIIGLITNTLFGLGIKVYPMGGFTLIIYGALLAYAIVRYQILNMDVIVRQGIIYTAVTACVIGAYALLVGVSYGIFGFTQFLDGSWTMNAVLGLAIAAAFLPLRNRIQLFVDQSFYKEKYNYQETLKSFSSDLTSILELDRLLSLLVTKIIETMHIRRGYIMMHNVEKDIYEIKYAAGFDGSLPKEFHLSCHDIVVRVLEKDPVVVRLGEGDVFGFDILRHQGIELVVPLVNKNRLIAIMGLGGKLSEDMYTDEDLGLLATVADQAAVAIENDQLSLRMRELEKDLHRADKLSALGTFASSVAHEIKNPLAAIKTFSQLVAKRFNDTKFRDKFNDIVPQEINRLESVLGQLANFGKMSAADFVPTRINKVLDDLLELLQYETFKHGITVTRECEDNIPLVMAVGEQLKQVFMNLILNAIQAMPQGGDLKIIIRSERSVPGGSRVAVIIKDSGCGMAKDTIEKIFKPFFTTKPEGTGLGLPITRKIVQEHNGSIEVSSEIDKGTTFTLMFPASVN